MERNEVSDARAVADLAEGFILATVEIAAPPERVFRDVSPRSDRRRNPDHSSSLGLTSRESCLGNQLGWEASFRALAESLATEPSSSRA